MNRHHTITPEIEYLTIVAPTASEAMDQFSKRGLSQQGYSIAGQIGRHRVAVMNDGQSIELISADDMVAATFRRVVERRV